MKIKARIAKIEYTPMTFCFEGRGMLYDPHDVETVVDSAEVPEDVDELEDEDELEVVLELMALVRSSIRVPASRCF